jgi:hypothetical protein
VGGITGYYGFKEQQALRAALLQRQQELEQSEWCEAYCVLGRLL